MDALLALAAEVLVTSRGGPPTLLPRHEWPVMRDITALLSSAGPVSGCVHDIGPAPPSRDTCVGGQLTALLDGLLAAVEWRCVAAVPDVIDVVRAHYASRRQWNSGDTSVRGGGAFPSLVAHNCAPCVL
jgi:hypothetical protein